MRAEGRKDAGAMDLGLACHVCGQLNPMSAHACGRCGTVLAPAGQGPHPAAYGQNPPQPASPSVHTAVRTTGPPGSDMGALDTTPQQRFDPASGQRLSGSDPMEAMDQPGAKTMFFGALQQQPVVPRLVVIKGEGGDGNTYHLHGTTTIIGRANGEITFIEDPFLSPSATCTPQTTAFSRVVIRGLSLIHCSTVWR